MSQTLVAFYAKRKQTMMRPCILKKVVQSHERRPEFLGDAWKLAAVPCCVLI